MVILLAIVVLLFPLGLVYAAFRDLVSYEIPNWLSVALVVDFLVAAALAGLPPAEIGLQLAAGALFLAIGAVLFAFRLLGGGDGKLMAACAVWVGWSQMVRFVVIVALVGGVFAFAVLLARRFGVLQLWSQWAWVDRLQEAGQGIPYGIAIVAGALTVFPQLSLVVGSGLPAALRAW